MFRHFISGLTLLLLLCGQRVAFAADDDGEIEYTPQTTPPAASRVGAGTRGPGDQLRIVGLAPRKTLGYTTRRQPVVYFSLSRETKKPIEIAVNDITSIKTAEKPVAEHVLKEGHRAGLLKINFAELKDAAGAPPRLEKNHRYEVVVVAKENDEPSANNSAKFSLEFKEVSRSVPPTELAKAAAWYGSHGIWFDCIDAINRAIDNEPDNAKLLNSRKKLLAKEDLIQAEDGGISEKPREKERTRARARP